MCHPCRPLCGLLLLKAQVRQSKHIVIVQHLDIKHMSLGPVFHLVCIVLVPIDYENTLVVMVYEHCTFLAMKIDFREKRVFLRYSEL